MTEHPWATYKRSQLPSYLPDSDSAEWHKLDAKKKRTPAEEARRDELLRRAGDRYGERIAGRPARTVRESANSIEALARRDAKADAAPASMTLLGSC